MQHDEELAEQKACWCRDCASETVIELHRAIEDLENRVMKNRDQEWVLYEMRLALVELNEAIR